MHAYILCQVSLLGLFISTALIHQLGFRGHHRCWHLRGRPGADGKGWWLWCFTSSGSPTHACPTTALDASSPLASASLACVSSPTALAAAGLFISNSRLVGYCGMVAGTVCFLVLKPPKRPAGCRRALAHTHTCCNASFAAQCLMCRQCFLIHACLLAVRPWHSAGHWTRESGATAPALQPRPHWRGHWRHSSAVFRSRW